MTYGKRRSPYGIDMPRKSNISSVPGVAQGGTTTSSGSVDSSGGGGGAVVTPNGAPSPVTDLIATYTANGDVQATWKNPDDTRFYRAQVTITDTGNPSTVYVAGERTFGTSYLWTRDQNQDNDPTVTVSVIAEGYDGNLSTTASANAAAPVPTLTSVVATWNVATGDVTFTHNASVTTIRLAIDGYLYDAPTPFVYTLAQNRVTHSGTPSASLSWSAVAANGFGQVTTAITGTATLPAPTTPTLASQSWASDPSTAGADLGIVVSALSGSTIRYVWTVDGVVQPDSTSGVLSYSFARNTTDHSGTPDPVLSVVVTGYDVLGRASSALSFTATNAAPQSLTAAGGSVAVYGNFNLDIFISQPTPPNDWKYNRVRVLSGASVLYDQYKRDYSLSLGGLSAANYQVEITVIDMFNQASATTTTGAAYMPLVTVADVRAGATYSDHLGTASSTLNGLKNQDVATTVATH